MSEFTADADATPTIYYYAVVRDKDGNRVSNCHHSHYSRDAAQRCAEEFLRPLYLKTIKADAARSAR